MDVNQTKQSVLVIGAGIMGAGIAQVAAQARHPVFLYDQKEGAANSALELMKKNFEILISKGKVSSEQVRDTLGRITIINDLTASKSATIVVEAIIENLAIKRSLFTKLEDIVSPECILATNTSSISVTAIANGLKHPERLVGMHFFNPVPIMKLVEVVSGLQTSKEVAQTIENLALTWNKIPVHAKSTPGFIVNRIARPFYAEALAMLQEQMAEIEIVDACIKSAGFKMGPFELMDLIGHDTNFAVTSTVFEAYFYDRRFTPSIVQKEMVDGGLLGRKSGKGFYDYSGTVTPRSLPERREIKLPPAHQVIIHGNTELSNHLANQFKKHGQTFTQKLSSDWVGIEVDAKVLRQTSGTTATSLGKDIGVFDYCLYPDKEPFLAWSSSQFASSSWHHEIPQWISLFGWIPLEVKDLPGLVVARTLSMLINEACDAVNQGVCTMDSADKAMKLGVNYPSGPFEWLKDWSKKEVIQILNALDHFYRGERYRVSSLLRSHTSDLPLNHT
jgi:3-hydroxybutyryl-CoA dehydrogenase